MESNSFKKLLSMVLTIYPILFDDVASFLELHFAAL